MSKYAVWIRIAVVVAGLYLLASVTPIYLPIIVAIILSFILNPMVRFLNGVRLWPSGYRLSHGWAVVLSILAAVIMLGGMMVFIFTPFVVEFNRFVINLPALIQRIQNLSDVIQERASALELTGNVRALIDQLLSSAAAYAVDLGKRALTSTVGFASRVVELVVVPVLTYYFLKDWRDLRDSFLKAFPGEGRTKARVIIGEMAEVVSGYIRGQVILSIIIGALVFSGMYFLGVDYPLVLGLLATLTETIPIIGPIIGAAPAILLAYLLSPALAVKVIVFFLVIHQIENHILVPKVMGRTIDLHPVMVIIALLIGGQLYGVVGMMLAVPVVALLKVLLRHLWQYE